MIGLKRSKVLRKYKIVGGRNLKIATEGMFVRNFLAAI